MPSYADGCELDLQARGEVIRIVAGVDRVGAERRERAPIADTPDHPIVAILRGGPARLIDIDVPDDAALFGPDSDPTSARSLGLKTAVLAPVVVGGKVVGSLALGRGARRRFGPEDLDVAVDLARRIGLAWQNAVLLAERASILAALSDGLVVTDVEGVVLEVNERWTELSGFGETESVGVAPPYPWWPDDDEVADRAAALTAAAWRDGRVEDRFWLQRRDGGRVPVLISMSPVVDVASGQRRALVVSVKDLTQWEAAEADLASIQRVTARLAVARDVADVVDATLAEATARTGADAVFLLRLDEGGQHVELVGSRGPLAEKVPGRGGFPVDRAAPANEAIRDGTNVVVRSSSELRDRYPQVVPEVHDLGVESVLVSPYRRGGEPVGALSLWSTRPGAFGEPEASYLESVAAQFGDALQRAEGYEVERRASQALQRRLLADVPVLHDRATIATRYHAATTEVTVGGDWYDVIPVGRDRLALVVGDVVGSGVEAAAVMGQLRSALKGIALVTPEPVAVLSALDTIATGIAGATGATVCYAVVDLDARTVAFSRAGHPPPLLIGARADAGARFLEGFADPPLGMGAGTRRVTTEVVGDGDVLFLYTDGLVERRDAGLVARLEVLRSSAAAADRETVEGLVDEVLAACMADGQLRDDLAVLALRDEPAGPLRFRSLVPAVGRELAPLRRSLRSWLDGVGADAQVADDLLLATSEAATNAIEHAYRDALGARTVVGVTATADPERGTVRVEVRDTGRWKSRPSRTTRGRGLAIARALLGDVSVRTGPSGTTVTFMSPLRVTPGAPG